jgi:RimJ/RimL family protein N-acetyltransferase
MAADQAGDCRVTSGSDRAGALNDPAITSIRPPSAFVRADVPRMSILLAGCEPNKRGNREQPMTPGIPTITTSRLVLRPLELSDADLCGHFFRNGKSCGSWTATFRGPTRLMEHRHFSRDIALPAIRQGTEWHWSIRLEAAPGRLIGMVSLMDKPGNNRGFGIFRRGSGEPR